MVSWLDGKKTYIAAVLGALSVIAGAFLGPEIAAQLEEGQRVLLTPGWGDDIKWVAAFLTAIFLRLGVAKGR